MSGAAAGLSADAMHRLAELGTLLGWTHFGAATALEVWENMEREEFPATIAGAALVELVERELAHYGIPADLLGPLTAERLEAFRVAYAEEWAAREEARSEGAYERQCAAFYGGSGPRSLEDECREARKLK